MARVTVSIPTYNRCSYLREAIESVLTQTFDDFQLLITDNGSQDGTQELVARYSAKDRRVVYHRFPTNQGPAPNWIYGITWPKTELVALLPDDDLWLPEHLEHAVRAMEENPEASLYGCITEAFGEYPNEAFHPYYRPLWLADCTSRTVYDPRQCYTPWLLGSPMAPPSIVLRRRMVDQNMLYNDNNFSSGDYMFYGQMALCGSMVFDPVVRVKYRWHAGNDTHRTMGTRLGAAQQRYVIRALATLAMERKALDPEAMVNEVEHWPAAPVGNMVVALAVLDAPPPLRQAAFRIFKRRPVVDASPHMSRHYRLAHKIGAWYLSIADLMDRMLGRWWHPVVPRSL